LLLATMTRMLSPRSLHGQSTHSVAILADNVGFDVRGNVRIFDFGLAKELKMHELVEPPDKYDATGLTGSRRFMSPECIQCLPYGLSSDVYSYSILFWQIFSLQVPFPSNNVRQHYEQVVVQQKRPNKHAAKVSPMLMNMMTSGWDADPSKRPLLKQICQQLQVEILDVTCDGAGGASIVDRSTHLMNRSLNSLYNTVPPQKEFDYEDDYE
jgi:serine/threonine protein kinase